MSDSLQKDKYANIIQGFEPTNVIAGSTEVISLDGYMAFRVSDYVDITYTFDGVENVNIVSLPKGSITVCTRIDEITCATAVTIEVM